jgi:hypothetical protein
MSARLSVAERTVSDTAVLGPRALAPAPLDEVA